MYLFIVVILLFFIFKKNKEKFTIGGQYTKCKFLTKIKNVDGDSWESHRESDIGYTFNVPCNQKLSKTQNTSCNQLYYINEYGENIKCTDDNTITETYKLLDSDERFSYCKNDISETKYCNYDGYPTVCSLFPYYTYYTGIKNDETSGCESLSLNNEQNCSDYFEYNETLPEPDFFKCKNDPNLHDKCSTNLDLHCKDKFLNELSSLQIYELTNTGLIGSGHSYYIDKFLNFCSAGIKTLSISLLYLIFNYVTENIDLLILQNQLYHTGPANPQEIYNNLHSEEMEDYIQDETVLGTDAANDAASEYHFSNTDRVHVFSAESVRLGTVNDPGDYWNDELTTSATIDADDYTPFIDSIRDKMKTNNLLLRYFTDLDKILDEKYENTEYMNDRYPYTSGIPDFGTDSGKKWLDDNYSEYYNS
jgi:hypothetical protein